MKTIETYGEIWKHFETDHLKTIETYGRFWKQPNDISLIYGHSGVTIETLGFQLALKWNTWECALMHGEKICFFHAVESIDFTTTVWSNEAKSETFYVIGRLDFNTYCFRFES